MQELIIDKLIAGTPVCHHRSDMRTDSVCRAEVFTIVSIHQEALQTVLQPAFPAEHDLVVFVILQRDIGQFDGEIINFSADQDVIQAQHSPLTAAAIDMMISEKQLQILLVEQLIRQGKGQEVLHFAIDAHLIRLRGVEELEFVLDTHPILHLQAIFTLVFQ